jgi:hypothetical protein
MPVGSPTNPEGIAMDGAAHMQPLERFFTTDDVAERYRTAPGTVRYWRHIGFGPRGTRVGRRYLYPEAEIRRFDAELIAKATAAIKGKNSEAVGGPAPTASSEHLTQTA